MEPAPLTLDGDNILTAARRVIRFIRIDDEKDGGLLSRQTIMANEGLARHVDTLERQIKLAETTGDHIIIITK